MKSSLSLSPQAPPCRPSNRPQEVVIGPPLRQLRAPEPPMMSTQRVVPAGGRGRAGARRNDLLRSVEGGKWHF